MQPNSTMHEDELQPSLLDYEQSARTEKNSSNNIIASIPSADASLYIADGLFDDGHDESLQILRRFNFNAKGSRM